MQLELISSVDAKIFYRRERRRIAERERRLKNPELSRQASLRWQRKNRKRALESKRSWYHKNKERALATSKAWKLSNKEAQKFYRKRNHEERLKSDLDYKLRVLLRNRIKKAVKAIGTTRCANTMRLIGCSMEEFKTHIESLFKPGMSWLNYGRDGWHIDHKRPLASFNLIDPEQQKTAFHYTNLQPLWKTENLRKGSFWNGDLAS